MLGETPCKSCFLRSGITLPPPVLLPEGGDNDPVSVQLDAVFGQSAHLGWAYASIDHQMQGK